MGRLDSDTAECNCGKGTAPRSQIPPKAGYHDVILGGRLDTSESTRIQNINFYRPSVAFKGTDRQVKYHG